MAVAMVWTSWLVRNEGRERGSEIGERREVVEMMWENPSAHDKP